MGHRFGWSNCHQRRTYYLSKNGNSENWEIGVSHAMVEFPNDKLLNIDNCGTLQKWKKVLNNTGVGPFAILKASTKDMYHLKTEEPKYRMMQLGNILYLLF